MPSTPAQIQAIEILAPRKFHQIFNAPATDGRGPLKVSYAIAGVDQGDDVPTILFCGGMFGTRWQATFSNWQAEKLGVRLLWTDRPGFGGSTPVSLEDRLSIFVETIPLLLAHLKINHVHIASQSAGTIFALNILAAHPHLLSPTNPSITLFSPWVHPSQSGNTLFSVISKIPSPVLNHWDTTIKFLNTTAAPTLAASGGTFLAVKSLLTGGPRCPTEEEKVEERQKVMENMGISVEVLDALNTLFAKFMTAEYCKGGNDEARLCLKSVAGTKWGVCEDFKQCVEELGKVWQKKVLEGGKKLRVFIKFPEEDHMGGEKGMRYFESCWTKERCGDGIELDVEIVKGTDHDSIVKVSEGQMGKMYSRVKASP